MLSHHHNFSFAQEPDVSNQLYEQSLPAFHNGADQKESLYEAMQRQQRENSIAGYMVDSSCHPEALSLESYEIDQI